MDKPTYEAMDEEELAEFLGAGGTGVVSFARGTNEPPHSVPVSYGYDATEGQFYFRLAAGRGREKFDLVDDGHVSLVVFDHADDGWKSVVATGRLQQVSEVDVSTGVLEGLRRVQIPLYDVFDRPTEETTFEFFLLDPDELSARRGHDGDATPLEE